MSDSLSHTAVSSQQSSTASTDSSQVQPQQQKENSSQMMANAVATARANNQDALEDAKTLMTQE